MSESNDIDFTALDAEFRKRRSDNLIGLTALLAVGTIRQIDKEERLLVEAAALLEELKKPNLL